VGRDSIAELRSAGRVKHSPLRELRYPIQSQRVQVRQQILDLLLRHDLTEPWHHVATREDHFADAFVIGRHSALRQELLFENALQAVALFVARRVRIVAAIAMLVVEPAARSLLRSQAELGVALAALHVAAAEEENQAANGHGEPWAKAAC